MKRTKRLIHYFAARDGGYYRDGTALLTPCGLAPGARIGKYGRGYVFSTDDPAFVTCPGECAAAAKSRSER